MEILPGAGTPGGWSRKTGGSRKTRGDREIVPGANPEFWPLY